MSGYLRPYARFVEELAQDCDRIREKVLTDAKVAFRRSIDREERGEGA